jgi:undecaprenyl-diphosphatase
MTYFEAFLYGAVQGVTEYLPISSSAHLILLPKFLGTRDPGLAFDVFLHLGTLCSTLIYFWSDWRGILSQLAGKPRKGDALPWQYIAVGTLPALVAGAGLHHWVETVFRGNAVLVTTLVVGGLALFLADHFAPRKRTLGKAGLRDAVWIGLAQCLALVPGMSRSGSTIMGGRLLGFDRTAAARFSFLLSAPVTGAALVFELRKWRELTGDGIEVGQLLVAGGASFLFGLLAIGGLLKLIRRFGYLSFAVYRVGLAVVIWRVLGL